GARGLGLVLDLARAVGDEGGDGGVAAAVLPGAPRVRVLAAVQGQEGEALLVVLDVADAADGASHLPARRDPVPEAEGADGAHHRVQQEVAEALAPLVDPAEARQRELARGADARRAAL